MFVCSLLWCAEDLDRSGPTAWEASQRLRSELGFIETDVEQMFTNQFIGR
jgi:hypothetical protein